MSRAWREHYHGFLQAQEIGQAKALEFGQLPNFIGEFKKMGFIATQPESNYENPPSGMHIARCYRLIDLGTQKKTYEGVEKGEARKVRASFELLGEDRMKSGEPFSLSKTWVLSMHEKAALRKDLSSWRGKPFTPEEEASFDVSKLLGAYCMLNVTEEHGKDGKIYIKISAITPLIKGLPKPPGVNQLEIFDVDNPDMRLFDTFSDSLKKTIQESREWQSKQTVSPANTFTPEDLDEDIPL